MSSLLGNSGLRGGTGSLAGSRPSPAPMAGTKLGGGYKQGQMQQFTPEQMQLFQSLFSQVGPDSFTSRLAGGDQDIFNQIEQPAMRQFGELQGGLASRFSGMGSMGARRSSGFQNTMNQAGSNFAQDLQSQRQSLQRQAIQDLMGMSQSLLGQKPYENFAIAPQQKQSFLSRLLGGAAPMAGALGGFALGGPSGAMMGGQLGNSFGQAFR